jgi:hypothetical protein
LAGIADEFHMRIPIAGGDLMKRGTSALVATAILLGGAGAATAQPLPPLDGPTVIYGSRAHYGGRVGPPVHAPYDGPMPSYEVAAILRSGGYLPLGGPVRRGGFYVVAAVHPSGDDGRVVIDAYSGRIVRFVPAPDVARASRGDEMVLVYQGPTFPPRDRARPVGPPPPLVAARSWGPPHSARGVPRPPAPVPNVASRTPSSGPATPRPRPQAAPPKPDTAQAPPVPAPVETKPAATSPPLVPKPPAEKSPVVQPTQPLPPVQTME